MSDKFENAKLDTYNAEQTVDFARNPIVKTLINLIPSFGNLLDMSVDSILTDFQESKRKKLLDIILSDEERITTSMVSDVEFILSFVKTINAVDRLAKNDKIEYFGYLLKNSFFNSCKPDIDHFDEYLHIISTLSYREIQILIVVYEYEKENVGNLNLDRMYEIIKCQLNIELNEIESIILRLIGNGLMYIPTVQKSELTEMLNNTFKIDGETLKIGAPSDSSDDFEITTAYFKDFAEIVLKEYT